MSVVIAIAAFLAAIGILIAVHEFGHFIVARAVGVKVLRFSIGFGRVLLSHTARSGTEYAISAIPIGGYVKLLDEREGEVAKADLPRAFNRQTIWRRAAILVAGPGFNLLFAAVAYWIVFVAGIPGLKPVVGTVAAGTPAAHAAVAERDTIVAVNGRSTPTWYAVNLAMLDAVVGQRPLVLRLKNPAGKEHVATLEYGDVEKLTRPGELLPGLGLSAWLPPLAPVIGSVTSDSPAAHAGLRSGDRIVAIDGRPVADWQAVVKTVQAHPGQRLELGVERDGRRIRLAVVPKSARADGKTVGRLGVTAREPEDYAGELRKLRAETRFGPLPALRVAGQRTGEVTTLTVTLLYRMAIGQASLANLSGPIDIAHYAGSWAQAGVVPFLSFLALISVSLGLVNILPIPVLDGGQLLFLAIEVVRRRPLSARAEAIGQRVGLSLIALLLGFAVFNDLNRLIH